ncbi:hypothetical protein AAXE64_07690 [Priestia megaterium]
MKKIYKALEACVNATVADIKEDDFYAAKNNMKAAFILMVEIYELELDEKVSEKIEIVLKRLEYIKEDIFYKITHLPINDREDDSILKLAEVVDIINEVARLVVRFKNK